MGQKGGAITAHHHNPRNQRFRHSPSSITSRLSNMTVYSNERTLTIPQNPLPDGLPTNQRVAMDGITFMSKLPDASIAAAFFDPQYRGVLDKLGYGNEGVSRGQQRSALPQMNSETIAEFIQAIHRVLGPSGHLFLWIDKFHLCSGIDDWTQDTTLEIVDLITWNKARIGMGYRTRRKSEYLIVLQKAPKRAKGIWTRHDIPDVWEEKAPSSKGVHPKPVQLQRALIEAVTAPGDAVLDPAAGSFSVLEACRLADRVFVGCDLNG